MYHCSQYGVTLIIPEGAVQESATVWFGACLFSDKFKFGDYVPVTPVVWVHIDRKLDKCAELYIPHDVAISSEANLQQFTLLTAHDDDCSDVISFQQNYGSQVQVSLGLFKILSPHFCSNCIAIQKRKYKSIPRRYLIARADKKNGSRELVVEFTFLCQQKGCKKVLKINKISNPTTFIRLLKNSVLKKDLKYYHMNQLHLLVMVKYHCHLSHLVSLVGKEKKLGFPKTMYV